ncbi:MAG TPA: hypothetical protein VKF39_06440 [Nitrososphaerales archaeon]|nr:hypothetical protein [Nitrososphaerales archaeon]
MEAVRQRAIALGLILAVAFLGSMPAASANATQSLTITLLPVGRSIPVNSTNYFTISYTLQGQPFVFDYVGASTTFVTDAGTNVTISPQTTQSTSREMWLLKYDTGNGSQTCHSDGACVLPFHPYPVSFENFAIAGYTPSFVYYYYDVMNSTVSTQFQGAPNGEWSLWPGSNSTRVHDIPVQGDTAPTGRLGPSETNCGFSVGDLYPHATPTVFYLTRGSSLFLPSKVYYNSTFVWQNRETSKFVIPFAPLDIHYDLTRGPYRGAFTTSVTPEAVAAYPGNQFRANVTIAGGGLLWNVSIPFGITARFITGGPPCVFETAKRLPLIVTAGDFMKPGLYNITFVSIDADQLTSATLWLVVQAPPPATTIISSLTTTASASYTATVTATATAMVETTAISIATSVETTTQVATIQTQVPSPLGGLYLTVAAVSAGIAIVAVSYAMTRGRRRPVHES